MILKAAAGEPIPLYGDGLNVRDWLYVEDHVDALLPAGSRATMAGSAAAFHANGGADLESMEWGGNTMSNPMPTA